MMVSQLVNFIKKSNLHYNSKFKILKIETAQILQRSQVYSYLIIQSSKFKKYILFNSPYILAYNSKTKFNIENSDRQTDRHNDCKLQCLLSVHQVGFLGMLPTPLFNYFANHANNAMRKHAMERRQVQGNTPVGSPANRPKQQLTSPLPDGTQ